MWITGTPNARARSSRSATAGTIAAPSGTKTVPGGSSDPRCMSITITAARSSLGSVFMGVLLSLGSSGTAKPDRATERQGEKREDDRDPREGREELDGHAADALETRLGRLERPEDDGGGEDPADAGACDGDERDRDEALARRDVAAEVADRADRDRRAPHSRERAGGEDGQALRSAHADAFRRRSSGVAPAGGDLEAEACPREQKRSDDGEADRQVEERVLRQKRRPEQGDVTGAAEIQLADRPEGGKPVLVLRVEEVAEPLPQQDEREPGDDDVGPAEDGTEHHQQRQR